MPFIETHSRYNIYTILAWQDTKYCDFGCFLYKKNGIYTNTLDTALDLAFNALN